MLKKIRLNSQEIRDVLAKVYGVNYPQGEDIVIFAKPNPENYVHEVFAYIWKETGDLGRKDKWDITVDHKTGIYTWKCTKCGKVNFLQANERMGYCDKCFFNNLGGINNEQK